MEGIRVNGADAPVVALVGMLAWSAVGVAAYDGDSPNEEVGEVKLKAVDAAVAALVGVSA